MGQRLFVPSPLKHCKILIPVKRDVVQGHSLWLTELPLRALQSGKSLRVNSGQSESLVLM